ncbi:hypothetical protein M9Y10_032522 [Tritrichomonas musculus]|uniref:Ribulokinase n=1 Tax=Tritrichomonas musculus TaxID=1915356 RepID=A0ABR2GZE7_9EUKA
MSKYTIGLDYGTLSARGVLVRCCDGKIMSSASKTYPHGVIQDHLLDPQVTLPPDWCLQDPQDYIEAIEFIIPELVKQSKVEKTDIIGIGIDFTSCTILPIDSQATPLCVKPEFRGEKNAYVKLWKHHGAQKQANKINEILTKFKLSETPRFGGKISSELMVPKVLEMLEEAPHVYESAAEILEAGDWLTRILTNSNKRSCSMAGYKAWWNENDGYPDKSFFAQVDERLENFVDSKLPGQVCLIGQKIGELSVEWSERLGLKPGIAVAPTVIDSHAGFPGSGASCSDQMLLVLGTSSVAIALGDRAYSEKGVCGGVKDAIVPGFYALESGLASVGDLFEWFVDNFVPMRYYKEAEEKKMSIHELLSEKADKLMPGQSGLLALDWWNGNKTPFVDGNLSGELIGMTLSTKPEDVYRCLIEATAFGTRMIKEVYEGTGIHIKEVIASGGIASKNPLLMQIYSDVLNVEIKIADCDQAAALGSAIYAALSAGKDKGGFDHYDEAVKSMSKVKNCGFSPNPNSVQTYNQIYQIYKKLSMTAGQNERDILNDLHDLKIKTINS